MRVIRRPKFVDDLYDAYAWIAVDTPTAAERLLNRVELTIDRLQTFPHLGTLRDDLSPDVRSVRVWPFRHLIFFRVSEAEITLIRLLHGARALEDQSFEI